MITAGMYLFEVFYSPGMGPVPFSYSAEAFPIQVRDVGMAFATATTWCFNFILALTWPLLVQAFQPQGAFGFYAAWCIILWVLVLLFMPETKGGLPSTIPLRENEPMLIERFQSSHWRSLIKVRCI